MIINSYVTSKLAFCTVFFYAESNTGLQKKIFFKSNKYVQQWEIHFILKNRMISFPNTTFILRKKHKWKEM